MKKKGLFQGENGEKDLLGGQGNENICNNNERVLAEEIKIGAVGRRGRTNSSLDTQRCQGAKSLRRRQQRKNGRV
jgi:hypothetical protein